MINFVAIAICAVICSADDFVAIANWAKAKREWLAQFLDLSAGIPSHDRFNAIFALLKPAEFEQCLLNWITALHEISELTLKTTEVPEEPPEIDAVNLTALREIAKMSQAVFARVLNVSPKTVQSWEQGVRAPSMASRRLIHVFSLRPEAVCEVVGVRAVKLHGVKIVPGGEGKRWIVIDSDQRTGKRSKLV